MKRGNQNRTKKIFKKNAGVTTCESVVEMLKPIWGTNLWAGPGNDGWRIFEDGVHHEVNTLMMMMMMIIVI